MQIWRAQNFTLDAKACHHPHMLKRNGLSEEVEPLKPVHKHFVEPKCGEHQLKQIVGKRKIGTFPKHSYPSTSLMNSSTDQRLNGKTPEMKMIHHQRWQAHQTQWKRSRQRREQQKNLAHHEDTGYSTVVQLTTSQVVTN